MPLRSIRYRQLSVAGKKTFSIRLRQQSILLSFHCAVRKRRLCMKSRAFLVLLAVLVLLVFAVGQASRQPFGEDNPDAHINRIVAGLLPAAIVKGQALPKMTLKDRMSYYHVPGVSIAFFDHGQIVWARSYGLADVATNRAVRAETPFQAASVSKSVTALAALRLVHLGKLNLDEDVNLKRVSWKVPQNELTRNEKVTLRRLLSHTAGFNVGGLAGYLVGEALPTAVQVLNGERPANNEPVGVDWTPGREFHYPGGGYVVLQLLMMDVTKKSFPQLMRDPAKAWPS